MTDWLTIGEAAEQTGLSAKQIRHYEARGLVRDAHRSDAGYRLYDCHQVQQLTLIRQARYLGFSLREIDALLQLWADPTRASKDVKALAERHRQAIRQRITELQQLEKTLSALEADCRGDDDPDCAILASLTDPEHRT
ncbi:Cu(I)-responsive transcriptional regulator [Aestuariibacter halophilus]|uniref:Cu(I)-responsive transcriptional regulator n=1 Tax=Fluctibacter halophilus TaxID=226011 RepID=A0ABS8G7Z4_9ALTE|nr:Cu(I)-responsive transcriptional regulator [Aestuariibacter halophilus]MCC2616548.1 Cu(I)-responsive transcriptional regulator [Aestuariibacter halophilus]